MIARRCPSCKFPLMEVRTAESVLRGDIPSTWDEGLVTMPSISSIRSSGKWLVMASSICFQVVPPGEIQRILTTTAEVTAMAYDIRNLAVASGYTGNISVVVVDITAKEELLP